ncbi:hypothetical protein BHE74_00040591 [Ensete ventricosum]|nr:hypothetical protein BHE74_00040591 [Ensete ventricosum]
MAGRCWVIRDWLIIRDLGERVAGRHGVDDCCVRVCEGQGLGSVTVGGGEGCGVVEASAPNEAPDDCCVRVCGGQGLGSVTVGGVRVKSKHRAEVRTMRLGTRLECVGSLPRVSSTCQDSAREFTERRPRLVKRLSGLAEMLGS